MKHKVKVSSEEVSLLAVWLMHRPPGEVDPDEFKALYYKLRPITQVIDTGSTLKIEVEPFTITR